MLCAAGPQELLAVRREAPFATSGPVGSRGRTIAAPEARAGSDYFVMAPTLSARAPGLLRTTAIRLVFAGSTRSLRAFLSGLAQGAEVEAVRSIEVESAGGGNGTAGVRRDAVPAVTPAADPTGPTVHAPVSIFTVTMEFLEAVAAENGPAAPAATVATAP